MRLVAWSARSLCSGFPLPWTSTERYVEAACPKTAHTYSALRVMAKIQLFSSLFGCGNSQWSTFKFIFQFLWVLLLPCFRHPASLVEESPDNRHIVSQDALGHSHSVERGVWSEVLPSPDRVLVDGPSWDMMRGTITTFETFFSQVSRVAHSRYLSSFSRKASFSLSVNVTFTSTTTFSSLLRPS